MRRTLGEVLDDRGNSLTSIRLILALMVLVAHSATVSGLADHPIVGGVGLGTWAVMAFFTASGYLVTQSRSRLSLGRYLVNRGARILPGFWAANLLTAFVAAPIAATAAGTSLDWSDALLYPLRNGLLVMNQWGIGGSLEKVPFPGVWNGSLWTLAQEGGWYLVVAVAFLLGLVRRNLVAASALLLLTMTALNTVGVPFATLGAFFAAGMLLHSVRDRVPASPVLLILSALVCVGAGLAHQVVLVAPLPLAYLVLAASALPLPGAGARTDLSYGVYIYAFPISQVLVVLGVQRFGLLAFTLATAALTTGFALLSWHLVEAPALGLARRLSRRAARTVAAPVVTPGRALDPVARPALGSSPSIRAVS